MKTAVKAGLCPADLVRRILLAWLTAATTEYMLLPAALRDLSGLEGLGQMSLLRVAGMTAALTVALLLAGRFCNTAAAERWAMAAVFGIFAMTAVNASPAGAFGITCAMVLVVLGAYALWGWDRSAPEQSRMSGGDPVFLWFTVGMALAFFLYVSAWTVGRVLSFSTPSYDFGLFAQMFHNMKETGLPMTTLERDGWLSHFAVHVSPIYYLMLPLYWLFPDPATLQVAQAAVLASAVIPLWKLGVRHGLTALQRTLLCAVMLLYPALAGGASYDLHENCFLIPLLLWLLYGLDRGNPVITAVSAVLTLLVKEDAAVYVAIVGLFVAVRSFVRQEGWKPLLTGIGMLVVSVVWFFLVTGYLAEQGDGVMTYRYDNFIYDGSSSLVTVIKAVLMNPLKAVYECVDPQKLPFIGLTLGPLLGLPLVTRRYERYLLLIPYVLVNLMSDYQYQHNIMFQYTFGSTACLLYLTVVNLADLKLHWQRVIPLVLAAVISFSCFYKAIVPTASWYIRDSIQSAQRDQTIRDALDTIPQDASVTASTYLTTHLSNRKTLYDVGYTTRSHLMESEYVALDLASKYGYDKYGGIEKLRHLLENAGYRIYEEIENTLVIYQAPFA